MNYLGNSSNIVDEIKNFFNSSASINQIQILSNFTEENYFEKCSDARVGR